MKLHKPSYIAVATALTSLLLTSPSAFAADSGEKAPLDLKDATGDTPAHVAGGGSIVRFDGQRLRVGPESAGAYPGPTAYRHGGPLTVTDANVLLGRIQPAFFPAVFGPDGRQPLDPDAVQDGFAALAEQIPATGRAPMAAEAIAAGALAIAVAQMAAAIRRISL